MPNAVKALLKEFTAHGVDVQYFDAAYRKVKQEASECEMAIVFLDTMQIATEISAMRRNLNETNQRKDPKDYSGDDIAYQLAISVTEEILEILSINKCKCDASRP